MEVIIFQSWLILFSILLVLAFWRKNAVFLLVAGLLIIAFGNVLTFEGLRVVTGFNQATGVFNYLTLLPINDQLIAIIAIVTLPLGIALSLFSMTVLYTELFAKYRLFS